MKFSLILGGSILCLVTANLTADVVTVAPTDPLSTTLSLSGWQPPGKTYTITNTVTSYVFWQASTSSGMVLSQPSGSWIGPGASAPVTIFPDADMGMAEAGTYTDQVTLDFQPRVWGDIDGDGQVDLNDVKLLVAMWGSIAGSPLYNPSADLDNSGSIDLGDLKILINNWGKSYSAISL